MFSATILDTKSFKACIDAIAVLIDDGVFHVDEKGLTLRAMDPSQIAMVDFELPASSFEKYKVGKPVDIGIDFTEFSKITNRARLEDRIELSFSERRLGIVFDSTTRREFNIPTLEASASPPKLPSIDFAANVKIGAVMMREALKDAELVSNHVTMRADKGFSILAEGTTGNVDIKFEDENLIVYEVKENAKAMFSLEYLDSMLKAANPANLVTLYLKTNAPLKIEYMIGEGKVSYYLAPRIENV